jgi:hypothetical protein
MIRIIISPLELDLFKPFPISRHEHSRSGEHYFHPKEIIQKYAETKNAI